MIFWTVPKILGKTIRAPTLPGNSQVQPSWAVLGQIMKKIEKAIQKWRRVGTQEDIWPLPGVFLAVFEVIPPSSLTLLVAGNAEKSAKNHRQ